MVVLRWTYVVEPAPHWSPWRLGLSVLSGSIAAKECSRKHSDGFRTRS